MEGHDHHMDMQGGGGGGGGQGGGGSVNSRWNPTKEQISMLENLYSHGIRTPSAEQIQQITRRLRVYGHIEGKNVFYWFQNHKARQRQKQKQESMANYLNHYLHNKPHLHHHQPLFAPPPCSNVVCGPYYLPQTELGFYPQTPKVLLPGAVKRRQRTDQKTDHKTKSTTTCTYKNHTVMSPELYNNGTTMMMRSSDVTNYYSIVHDKTNNGGDDQEILPLFPLHPTGILRGKGSVSAENSVIINTPSCSSSENGVDEGFGGDNIKPFFDFFHGSQGVCETD